ncbi:MAG TPA: GNAT family N-acetyltransferase [Candidatus Hydrogenedentes bacterium]|nr:GNAT family N-acetyltransferase [Candidatus Hydrogenedentota bacterium]
MKFTIKPVETRDELRMATDLMVGVHTNGDLAATRWLEDASWRYPAYRTEHTRIATRRGEVLGALRLTTDTVRIGEARLKMGGLGWVATSPRHRKRGVGRRLIEDTLAYMRTNGYHISMLFGIPNFYHRFGFITSLTDYTILMTTSEALTFENPFKPSFAKPGEVPLIQRMHNANDANAVCSLVRTTAHMHNKWGRWSKWRLLKDEQGRAHAYLYAIAEGDCLYVIEAGVSDIGVCAAVVRAAGVMAKADELASIRFCVPPANPIARFLAQFPSVHEAHVERDGGGMMACINIGETLESMIPEWESQLAKSAAIGLRTDFTLVVDRVPFRIRANRGAIDVAATAGTSKISLKSTDLMHLLTGYRYPSDILDERRCLVTTDARALFNAIFPKRHPYVWRFDRF